MRYIMSLDEGTTSARTIIFSEEGDIVAISQKEFPQYFPQPGWVEHDPEEIFQTQVYTMREALKKAGLEGKDISAIGITNQRETTILWDKDTGKPVYNAIVWQCRRTGPIVDELKEKGYEGLFRKKTGLVLDAYFSGTKIKWILDNVEGVREKAEDGRIKFGTIDSYLIYKLTGGKVHVTDYSNASRTLIYNIKELNWDEELLDILSIPKEILPEVMPSSYIYGYTDPDIIGAEVPISGILGDQQAALFGQSAFSSGMAKNTYGTGSFLLLNTGNTPVESKKGLLTTIAWGIDDVVYYALEGSIFITGAAVQWLRDGLGIISDSREIEALARSVDSSGGVYFVPAFTGLGAPYWDMYARGMIIGLTRGTTKAHIARATEEAIAFQVKEVLDVMQEESGHTLSSLRVDGGGARDDLLLKIQADFLGIPVERPVIMETTALGAYYVAGLGVGIFKSTKEIEERWKRDRIFEPSMTKEDRDLRYNRWKEAIKRAMKWEDRS